jgi:hypothetical protein
MRLIRSFRKRMKRGPKMILPDEQQVMLLEIKSALDKAVAANDMSDLITGLAFVATKSGLLWNRIVGNEPGTSDLYCLPEITGQDYQSPAVLIIRRDSVERPLH